MFRKKKRLSVCLLRRKYSRSQPLRHMLRKEMSGCLVFFTARQIRVGYHRVLNKEASPKKSIMFIIPALALSMILQLVAFGIWQP